MPDPSFAKSAIATDVACAKADGDDIVAGIDCVTCRIQGDVAIGMCRLQELQSTAVKGQLPRGSAQILVAGDRKRSAIDRPGGQCGRYARESPSVDINLLEIAEALILRVLADLAYVEAPVGASTKYQRVFRRWLCSDHVTNDYRLWMKEQAVCTTCKSDGIPTRNTIAIQAAHNRVEIDNRQIRTRNSRATNPRIRIRQSESGFTRCSAISALHDASIGEGHTRGSELDAYTTVASSPGLRNASRSTATITAVAS
jgi:hypothetical protein